MFDNKKRWYQRGQQEPHKALFRSIEDLAAHQEARESRNQDNVSRYLNKVKVGMKPGEIGSYPELWDNLSLNLSHSAVSAISQKICMRHPRPYFLTSNGSYDEQENAKKLQRFVLGQLEKAQYYEGCGLKAFIDGAVQDIGAIAVYPADDRIVIERVMPNELIVDENAAYCAPPREIKRVRYIPREVLAEMFPEKRNAIRSAQCADLGMTERVYDLIEVAEAWHLKSGKNAKDGKRIVAINEETLEISDWDRDHFPFVFFRWDLKPVGFFGYSLVDQLGPIQDEINRVVNGCQEAMEIGGNAWVFYEKGTINKRHLKNKHGIFIEKTGGPDPKVVPQSPLSPQWIEWIDYLWAKGMALAGVSELTAHSQLPERLRGSGEALRTLKDTETERFGIVANGWDQAVVSVSNLILESAEDLQEQGVDLEVEYSSSDDVERIKFSDCKVGDGYAIKVRPTSMLPDTPSGKMATAQELINLGAVTNPVQALEHVEYPDVDKFLSLETSSLDAANMCAEYILSSDDNWIAPEEFMDLELCKKVATMHWVRGYKKRLPERRLENLARWIKQCIEMQEQAQQQEMQKQMEMQQQMMAAQQPPQQAQQPAPAQQPGMEQPESMPPQGPGMGGADIPM